jgi:hypothetical protein
MSDTLGDVMRGLGLTPPTGRQSQDDYYRYFDGRERRALPRFGWVVVLLASLAAMLR